MSMRRSWEDARAERRAKGRAEGRIEGRADAVLTVLRVRGIAVSDAARKRILAQKDLQRLERWLEKASIATSIGDVINDRAEDRSSKTAKLAAHKDRNGRKPLRASAQR